MFSLPVVPKLNYSKARRRRHFIPLKGPDVRLIQSNSGIDPDRLVRGAANWIDKSTTNVSPGSSPASICERQGSSGTALPPIEKGFKPVTTIGPRLQAAARE